MPRNVAILAMAIVSLTVLGSLAPALRGEPSGRASGQDLTVNGSYTVGGSEAWDTVYVQTGGTLTVPTGSSLTVKSIQLQGGSLLVSGGTVSVVQNTPGLDAVIMGDCADFNVSKGAQVTLTAPDGTTGIDQSQGGEAIVQVNASNSAVVTGGSVIKCTGGNGYGRATAWTTAPLSGYVSAGGRGSIILGGAATPYVEVSGGAQLITIGKNGGRAADGKPGNANAGGTGGGYSNGGMVSGFVGSGGDGAVEIDGLTAVLKNAAVQCSGGRGGDAGSGAAGSTQYGNPYYYEGGGGGGGYAGGNGGSDYNNGGKSGSATDNVGAGGYALLTILSMEVFLSGTTVTLSAGSGGTPGTGGLGGYNNYYYYYQYYAPGGGGGGFGGGGGGSSYGSGGSGAASGNVGAGGESNMSIQCQNLTIDGLTLTATGGNSQKGGNGGDGYGGGGGGGGYGGGGGGGGEQAGGNGQASGNVGSGGNGTFVATAQNIFTVNTSINLYGGTPGNGGNGGKGGSYGGGGGGGYGGGGGEGYDDWSGTAGPGSCNFNVGRGGMALFRMESAGNLWFNTSSLNVTGGPGGNAGAQGTGSGGGGGGGGYTGCGGGGQYSQSSAQGSISGHVGDGGDAQMEFYCARGSIPTNGVSLNVIGGIKGDGLTKKGGGSYGGEGKGRATSNGGTPENIPRLIPITLGPANGSLYNNLDPTLSWMKCMDAVQFPNIQDPVMNYEVIIDNDTSFPHPAEDAKDIESGESAFVPSGLLGGKYYWEVRALYEGAKSPGWSDIRNFLKNGPPNMLRNIPPISFPENTNLTHAVDLNAYFTDDLYPNDLSYSVSYEQDPTKVHAMVDGSWLNLYTMQDQWYGKKEFKVRATDKGGIWADSNNFTVTVTPVNDPPYFKDVPQITVTEDQGLTFDMSPYVGDPDTPQSQLKLVLQSAYATVDGLNIMFYYPRGIGTDRINVSLTDGQWPVWTWITVQVISVNDKPVTLPIPDLTTNENTNLTLDLTPFGMDEEDSPSELKWRAENVPTDLFTVEIDEHNVMTVVPDRNEYGEGKMLLVVTDTGGLEALANLTVKVLHVNQAPVIAGVPDIKVSVNVPYKLDVKAYVSDVDNDLTELRVTTNSLYAAVSGFVITFQYPNDESLESEIVRITVSDGKAAGHQDIHVTLSFPPAFTEAIPPLSVEATKDINVDLTRYANDREDGPTGLKWSVSHLDKTLIQVTVDSNASMRVKSVGDKTGSTEFILTATDSDGNRVNATVQVTVTPKKSAFGGVGGGDLLLWALPVVIVAAIIGASASFYMVASRRKRRLEEEQARQDRQMLPTAEQKMVTLGTGTAGPQSVPEGKVCFACGSKLRVVGAGSFTCTKCGRLQK